MQHIVIVPEGGAAEAVQAYVVPDTPRALALAVDAFIARLDELDGDAELESNGDELDGNVAEDDHMPVSFANSLSVLGGPGCSISDPDRGVDDDGEPDADDGGELEHRGIPRYGIDQTKGPINEIEAHREHMRRLLAETAP